MPPFKSLHVFSAGVKRFKVFIKRLWNREARSNQMMPPQTPPPDW